MHGRTGRTWGWVRLVTTAYWAAIFAATHLPPAELPKIRPGDKVIHFIIYAALSILLHLSLWPTRWRNLRIAIFVPAIALAYGAMDELTQPLVGRSCSIWDWYANACGALAATAIMFLLMRWVRNDGQGGRAARDPQGFEIAR